MSTVLVTSSPFQILSDINPDFTSNLSFKIANASDGDGGGGGGGGDGGDGGGGDGGDGGDGDGGGFFGGNGDDGGDDGGKSDDGGDDGGNGDDGGDDGGKSDDGKDDDGNGGINFGDAYRGNDFFGNDDQGDIESFQEDEESDQDSYQTTFEGLGGNDEAEEVDQEAQTETDQTAAGGNIGQEAQQQAKQEAAGTGATQQVEQKAKQLGIGVDVAQQLAQETSQIGIGENVAQQVEQKAKQLGIGVDVAQQLAQETSQIGIGDVKQDTGQLAEQQAFGADLEQKISQTATQIAQSTEDLGNEEPSDLQQTIRQIATQSASGGADVNQIINQISTQIANNPKSDLAISLGNLAGLYGSGNYDGYNKAVKQIGTQIAIGNDITQTIIQTGDITIKNYFDYKIKYDIDYYDKHYKHYHYDDDDYNDVKIVKKIYKRDNTCPTQSDSTLLKGKILGKGIIVLADFEPCKLSDGRATLNIPINPNLKFVVLSLDKKGNDNDGALVSKQKIQSLNKGTGLYVVYFDDRMTGIDPITGKKKTIDEINGLALYNTGTKSIDLKSGNSLALTAVLKK